MRWVEGYINNVNIKYIVYSKIILNKLIQTGISWKQWIFTFEYSSCLNLVPWGVNLTSTVGDKLITKQEREKVNIPNLQFGVIIGVILSNGYLASSVRSINKRLYI